MRRVLWIDPIAFNDHYRMSLARALASARREDTAVDLLSLPVHGAARHLRYHAYEALAQRETTIITAQLAADYDAFVIGCFYDFGLREAREVSGAAVVTAPGEASLAIASHLGNRVSILVGAAKAIPKMRENAIRYGHGARLVSLRPIEIPVLEMAAQPERTFAALLREGRRAVEEDGAESIILGCTAEVGFAARLQAALALPVIDPVLAAFKQAEALAEMARELAWRPSRRGGNEAPPAAEWSGYCGAFQTVDWRGRAQSLEDILAETEAITC